MAYQPNIAYRGNGTYLLDFFPDGEKDRREIGVRSVRRRGKCISCHSRITAGVYTYPASGKIIRYQDGQPVRFRDSCGCG